MDNKERNLHVVKFWLSKKNFVFKTRSFLAKS
jgi:hypothetical protein